MPNRQQIPCVCRRRRRLPLLRHGHGGLECCGCVERAAAALGAPLALREEVVSSPVLLHQTVVPAPRESAACRTSCLAGVSAGVNLSLNLLEVNCSSGPLRITRILLEIGS